jgi:hypothetical protein
MATAVVNPNIADVRGVVRNLQNQLNNNPMLMKNFGEDPRAVLQNCGLARNVQWNLLQEKPFSPHQKDIQCLCGSLLSIWTTIFTIVTPDANGENN